MKKLTALLLLGLLVGCVTAVTDKSLANTKKLEPLFSGEIKGDYSFLARCVADKMETHKNRDFNALDYKVRVYPDIEKSEVHGYGRVTHYGSLYAFHMEIKKITKNVSNATIRGAKYEGGEALRILNLCSEK